jgi:hypothetical protein
MTLKELILKLQELDKKYEQYSQDTEVVLAIHSKNEFNPEVNLDYIFFPLKLLLLRFQLKNLTQ